MAVALPFAGPFAIVAIGGRTAGPSSRTNGVMAIA
jgi:hypothetical protein